MATANKGMSHMEYNNKRHPKAIKKIALLGLSQEESAPYLGISLDTFKQWMKKYPEARQAWDEGAMAVDGEVANALLKSALGYNYTKNTTKTKESSVEENSIEETTEEMHQAGNVQAQMFWLANRQRSKWKMKHSDDEDEKNSTAGGPVTMNFIRMGSKE